jgi:hypothetical protein
LLSFGAAMAEPVALAEADYPPWVVDEAGCDMEMPGRVTREPFAGSVLFRLQCADDVSAENEIERLVLAQDDTGSGQVLLSFPWPGSEGGDAPATELERVRVFPEVSAIGGTFLFEDHEFCRMEALWRIEGQEATLILARNTSDCSGETGWTVTKDIRSEAERQAWP